MCIFIISVAGIMLPFRSAMIHSDPATTRNTISTLNATASTLLVLSGPVPMCRKNASRGTSPGHGLRRISRRGLQILFAAHGLEDRHALEIAWNEVGGVGRYGGTDPRVIGQERISDPRKRVGQEAAADEARGIGRDRPGR